MPNLRKDAQHPSVLRKSCERACQTLHYGNLDVGNETW